MVTLSGAVGPRSRGIIALFPVVFTSLMLILQPRIGGPATAAVIANGLWGLIGFGIAIVVLHLVARCRTRLAGWRSASRLRPASRGISGCGSTADTGDESRQGSRLPALSFSA